MSFGAVLETAIGLVFIFLLLSLIGTAAQEVFAAISKLRGKYLLEGLSRLLADDTTNVWRARNHLFGRTLQAVPGTPAAQVHAAAENAAQVPTPTSGFAREWHDIKRTFRGLWKAFKKYVLRMQGSAGSSLFQDIVAHPLISDTGSTTAPSYATATSFFTALTENLRGRGSILAQIAARVDQLPANERAPLALLIAQRSAFGSKSIAERSTYLLDLTAEVANLTIPKDQSDLTALLNRIPPAPVDPTTAAFVRQIQRRVDALPADATKTALLTLLQTPPTGAINDLQTTAFVTAVTSAASGLTPGAQQTALNALLANPPASDPAATAATALLADIAAGIDGLPATDGRDSDFKRTLKTLLAESLGQLDLFQRKVENWFDASMERMTGIYKRFTQYFALGFGIVIAIFLNVDAIQVADRLWTDDDARAAIVAAAGEFVEKAAETTQTQTAGTDAAERAALVAEVDTARAAAAAEGADDEDRRVLAEKQAALAEFDDRAFDRILDRFATTTAQINQQLSDLPVPIGRTERCGLSFGRWLFSGPQAQLSEAECNLAKSLAALSARDRERVLRTRLQECESGQAELAEEDPLPEVCLQVPATPNRSPWLYGLGWLLTGLAVSLGAPFWFDLLKKFMNIRSAGAAPDESRTSSATR